MGRRKGDFSEKDKITVLLWCDRHCCLCGKAAGLDIEVAHLKEGRAGRDNAIPLCFNCHAAVGRYNKNHPLGRKYSLDELKARREQIYEQHTRHLVHPVKYGLSQKPRSDLPIQQRSLPDVGFYIINLGNTYPVRARVTIELARGSKKLDPPVTTGHYNGKSLWNLNPGLGVDGHFRIPHHVLNDKTKPLKVMIKISLIDILEREHLLLPVWYIHPLGRDADWYLEPAEIAPFSKMDIARLLG
jgi:hypothetical protein